MGALIIASAVWTSAQFLPVPVALHRLLRLSPPGGDCVEALLLGFREAVLLDPRDVGFHGIPRSVVPNERPGLGREGEGRVERNQILVRRDDIRAKENSQTSPRNQPHAIQGITANKTVSKH